MNYSSLLAEVEGYVKSAESGNASEELLYHNGEHTQRVVFHATQIAKHYKLDDKDYFTVITAAWFHDCGYFSGKAAGHEERGINVATAFLQEKKVEEEIIMAVGGCIRATHMPQSPENLLEEILCDADLYHLGTDDFEDISKLVRKEIELRTGKKIDKAEWRLKTIALMESHHFYTDYCQQLLNGKKRENLEKLIKKAQKAGDELPAPNMISEIKSEPEKVKKQKPKSDDFSSKKQKSDRPEKGIETMFRITSGNHQRLSDMADNKANIMISTNSIIISVLLSVLLRKLEDNSQLVLPTILLLTVCVTTMVFSILSTRPSVPPGTFTEEDIDQKTVNLLFFGNFYKMTYPDYASGMQAMMDDRAFLYGSLTRDIYAQGVVLGKKYRYLRIAYNVFMFGIVISVVTFVASSVFFGSR
ncbi:Pycsar system effector family protein [Dyadobacter sp. 3J3]|uniref:Pycsar system effector family protein n=1 Tax=Dyadobacter sp. 3J3 TaxID=2606600 RepID=UPI00135B071B|nr:Pycsar system effector family protein [Dyadobacter sp. 3J3]